MNLSVIISIYLYPSTSLSIPYRLGSRYESHFNIRFKLNFMAGFINLRSLAAHTYFMRFFIETILLKYFFVVDDEGVACKSKFLGP